MTDERKAAGSDATNPPHYVLREGYEVYDLRQDLAHKTEGLGVPNAQHNDWDRALEYLLRMWWKGGLEDLRKAQWYLRSLEEKLDAEQEISDPERYVAQAPKEEQRGDAACMVDGEGVPYVKDDGMLPEKANYVATDQSGRAYAYMEKPIPVDKEWLGGGIVGEAPQYALADRPWTETLRRVIQ